MAANVAEMKEVDEVATVAAETIIPTVEVTDDGSQTLRHPLLGEAYHSTKGAVAEAMHVFIEHGLRFRASAMETLHTQLRILEVGFGSGLNAQLTLEEGVRNVAGEPMRVHYTAIELYPIDTEFACGLEYAERSGFKEMHRAPWSVEVQTTDCFSLRKVAEDLRSVVFNTVFDLVYFDAFAPDSQPRLWDAEVFGRIYAAMSEGGVLVTYSAKGDVKRALREAGFEVRRLPGALGKRHMLRAVKKLIDRN